MGDKPARQSAERSQLPSALIDETCSRFETAWQSGQQPRIEDFLPAQSTDKNEATRRSLLVLMVGIDLEWRWKTAAMPSPPAPLPMGEGSNVSPRPYSREESNVSPRPLGEGQRVRAIGSPRPLGEGQGVRADVPLPFRPRLADYFARYPLLGPVEQLPTDLIVNEYYARCRYGDRPTYAEYLDFFGSRHPDLAKQLQAVDAGIAAAEPLPSDLVSQAGPRLESIEAVGSPSRRAARDQAGPAANKKTPPSAPSLDEFARRLTESGLMTDQELRQVVDPLPLAQRPAAAETLARLLVQKGLLTKYQAQAVYQGKTKGLVFGEYVVLEKLGEGGMGVVLKAQHRRMKRFVAVKMIAKKAIGSSDAVQRFLREVEAAAKLNHPNIVAAYDASERDGIQYLVMEYVDGKDLAAIVKDRGPMAVHDAVDCILQAARGLQFAHKHHIVHRDIKPSNLLLDKEGTVKILDMGLARTAGLADDSDRDRLTGTGQVMGTCDYMAPEQALDAHHADARADIYSLGCTLYRLLTGHVPYKGESLIQVLMAHRESPIPPLGKDRPDVPPQLDAVYQKMVAKEPEDRYQSMTEVIIALETCFDRKSASAISHGDGSTAAFAAEDDLGFSVRGFAGQPGDGCQDAGRVPCRNDLVAAGGGRGNQQTRQQSHRTRGETPGGCAEEENAGCRDRSGGGGSHCLGGDYLRPHLQGHAGNPDRRPERESGRETKRRVGRSGRRQVRLEDQSQIRRIRSGPAGQHGPISAR